MTAVRAGEIRALTGLRVFAALMLGRLTTRV